MKLTCHGFSDVELVGVEGPHALFVFTPVVKLPRRKPPGILATSRQLREVAEFFLKIADAMDRVRAPEKEGSAGK